MDDRGGDPFLGRVVGGYRLETRIGAGATGIVYRATRAHHDKPFAVKVLHENLGRISSLKRRFEREARALSKLDHPSIVHIADFGVADDATYLAMELLQGETLEARMLRGPLSPDEVLSVTKEFLHGLGFAHKLQIVHRDLKPANIFLTVGEDARVKILDFGLAKFLSIDEISSDATLTRRGRIVGTPAYMSPEQITGVALDVRADVYAAGVVLFELLADTRPFDYESRADLLRAHLFEEVPSLASLRTGLDVHPKLEAVVKKALAKDPTKRFATATDMLRAIEGLPREPIRLSLPGRVPRPGRRRASASSVVISEDEIRAITSGSSSGDRSSDSVRRRTASDVVRVASDAKMPLGGLPFDELERARKISIPPRPSAAASLRRIAPWILLLLLALVAGVSSYLVGKRL